MGGTSFDGVYSGRPHVQRSTEVAAPDQEDMLGDGIFDQHARLQQLTRPHTAASLKEVLDTFEDPFGLLESGNLNANLLARGYGQAENLIKNVLPTLPKTVRKSWEAGRLIELPKTRLGLYEYVMTASKDPVNSSSMIHFSRSEEEEVTNRGFRIIKNGDDHVVLKDPSREGVNQTDEQYGELVERAVRWIHDYGIELGHTPQSLSQAPVPPSLLERRAALMERLKPAPQRQKAVIASACFLAVSGTIFGVTEYALSGPSDAQIAAEQLASDRSIAANFDTLHPTLSTSIPSISEGTSAVIPIGTMSREVANEAPAISADTVNNNPAENGIRHIIDLSWNFSDDKNEVFDAKSKEASCSSIAISVGQKATLQIVTLDPGMKDKLRVNFGENSLEICNDTNSPLYSGLENVYMDIHNPTK
jgi:hypothetical protein